MATSKTTIELNGKLYDARSGKVISNGPTSVSKSAPKQGMVLDGFVRRPPAVIAAKPMQPPKAEVKPVIKPKPAAARTTPVSAKTKLQKSKTLMRPAVKKPQPVAQKESVSHHKFKKEDHSRSLRAAQTPKSSLIKRFNLDTAARPAVVRKHAVLPVAAQPAATAHMSGQVAHLATAAEAQVKHSVDIIEESLRQANSHLEVFEDNFKRSFLERFGFRNRAANLASLSVAGLLLLGFFAYQNVPNIEMRVAAARAGVSAEMPGYSPAGFRPMNGVKAEPGKVALTFRSNTDDKQFTITQQASNWSSDSLLTHHVTASNRPYQSYQDEGKTVYIYDNSNATWVNGGVWYKVEGNASLSSDQLLRIAKSF